MHALPNTTGDSLRRLAKRRFFRIDVSEPAVGVGHLAVDDVEERLLQRGGDRTAAADADLNLVDRADRRHLSSGADDEHFVGDIERLARNVRFGHAVAEIARESDDRITRDAAEYRRRERRR